MTHLSRLSEELVLWSSTEFGFVELDDAFCTGSSIMPQKKNPDVPELVRGKTGRVYGNLIGLLTVLKSLPLAYNKDMQEDKEGMFDTVATLEGALQLFAPMIATMKVNKGRMRQAVNQDFSNATDIADFLVGEGLPFRQAHEVIGKTVLYCIQNGKYLLDLSIDEFRQFSRCLMIASTMCSNRKRWLTHVTYMVAQLPDKWLKLSDAVKRCWKLRRNGSQAAANATAVPAVQKLNI